MDTSETYIKMCEKAEEIQKQKPKNSWVGILCWGNYDIEPEGQPKHLFSCSHNDHLNERAVWLPYQDQLQEMVFNPPNSTDQHRIIFQLNVFYDYWDENGIPTIFDSWEQLWLAFVMKEKYNKVWDGQGWVNNELSTS